jgi:hypothetical protein
VAPSRVRRRAVRATAPWVLIAGAFLLAPAASWAADPARELHATADAIAVPGLALAWGVLRATNEGDAALVLRVEPDVRRYAWVEVVGRDPATQHRVVHFPATEVGGAFDVRIPRARLADHPSTEILLWPREAPPPAAPALVVDFARVPDTAPESVRPGDLARALGSRVERARAEAVERTP